METSTRKNQKGFIALMSAIIISMILVMLIISSGTLAFFARLNVLNGEYKRVSKGLAESCANAALLKASQQGYGYPPSGGGTVINLGAVPCTAADAQCCTISSVAPVSGSVENAYHQRPTKIVAIAQYKGAFSNMSITAMVQNPAYSPVSRPTLTVVVQVVNSYGGAASPANFPETLAATNPTQTSFNGAGGNGTVIYLDPGSFNVSQGSGPAGYQAPVYNGCSGTAVPGGTYICTITNNDVPTSARLTVIANVTNDNGGTLVPAGVALKLDGNAIVSGALISGLVPGSHAATAPAISGYTASIWSGDCASDGTINLIAGDSKTCTIVYDDNPPPTPACAETVMMLDRSYSMFGWPSYPSGYQQWIPDEKNAAKNLITLYGSVNPHPNVGVGRFGDVSSGTSAEMMPNGHLTSNYTNLPSIIDNGLPQNPISYTNLSDAISTGSNELNGSGHVPGKQKVLILVSDGEPNEPSGSVAGDTGFNSPTASAQNASGDSWGNAVGVYATGGSEATDIVSGANRERYSSLNFPAFPSGATIAGIEAQATAWSAPGSTTAQTTISASGTGNFNAWNANSGTVVNAVATNDSDTTYINPPLPAETFAMPGAAISAAATNISVTLHAVARQSSGTASIQLMAENGSSQIYNLAQALTGSYVDYSWTVPTMPNGAAWTVAEVNAWTTKFGVLNTGTGTPRVTQIYAVVNYTVQNSTNSQKAPSGTMGSPSNQWSNANNAYSSDGLYATDLTNGHNQGYTNFGFSIPSGAAITGIQVSTEAKVSGGTSSTNTGTLYPYADGNYTQWSGDWSDVDETSSYSCSSSDAIITNSSNSRSSFVVDLSSIPDGSTINSITVTPSDRADSSNGGTYKTFIRLNGVNTDAGSTIATNSTSGCTTRSGQIITPTVTVKNSGTILEIGVVKINSGGSTNNMVRVGALNATVNYTPAPSGSLAIALSSNNGGSWTSAESVSLNATESVSYPSGNSSTDKWGRPWSSTDFNNGSFALRITNNSSSGTTVSLDQVLVNVYYTTTVASATGSLLPSSLGAYNNWQVNSGSAISAVASNDSDTTYIYYNFPAQSQTFSLPGAAVPAGATNISVALHAVAKLASGSPSIKLMAENGSSQIYDSGHSLTSSYVDYNWTVPTMPNGNAWTVAEVNAWTTKFGVQNTAGGNPRVTQLYVVVGYTYTPANSVCQLGVDLSWNGGTNWSNEKTQALSASSAPYSYGSASDKWGGTHTWQAADFSNANFLARVHAINPGPGCQGTDTIHLDWLQIKIHYTAPVDPTQAALNAADSAKQPGGADGLPVDIFTIHFGDSAGRGLLAQLASGSTPNPPHQNGSSYNLSGSPVSADTGYIPPAVNAADTGGHGDGFELNPVNVYSDGSGYASNMAGASDRHRFWGYNFNLPASVSIAGIQARTDWWTDSTSGTNSMTIELSYDGGTHWVSETQGTGSTSDTNSKTVGGSTDTWGRTWSVSDFSSANFRVRVTSNCSGSSSCNTRNFYLDWLPVKVYYTSIPENGDGDNFFISPTSADMTNIFHDIGAEVCPAAVAPPPPAPPTTGTLVVITHVINDNGAAKGVGAFSFAVNGGSSTTGMDAPGFATTLSPGAYTVTETADSGYVESLGSQCSGIIAVGQIVTCVIVNDDKPTLSTVSDSLPPPSNIKINAWMENQ
jgi:hypothetical protein